MLAEPVLNAGIEARAEKVVMKTKKRSIWSLAGTALAALFCAASVGCQGYYGGQTLPSPHYQGDDVQFHSPGPEMKLSREAAAQKEYNSARGRVGQ